MPAPTGYPRAIVAAGHLEPVPRRIRATLDERTVLDTTHALYLWEWPFYPQFLIPSVDVAPELLAGATRVPHRESPAPGTEGYVHFDWAALDAWFEEDEEVFVHPRNPYVRVDALRSSRTVRVELGGAVLAESSAPVMVFETGLPTRCYFNRTAVDFEHLRRTDTVTSCPYKGRTSQCWSVEVEGKHHQDLAWSYDFPTRQMLPIAGLVAFLDEKVDVFVDGQLQCRPQTHFGD